MSHPFPFPTPIFAFPEGGTSWYLKEKGGWNCDEQETTYKTNVSCFDTRKIHAQLHSINHLQQPIPTWNENVTTYFFLTALQWGNRSLSKACELLMSRSGPDGAFGNAGGAGLTSGISWGRGKARISFVANKSFKKTMQANKDTAQSYDIKKVIISSAGLSGYKLTTHNLNVHTKDLWLVQRLRDV